MPGPLQHASWGPFTRGVVDRSQSSRDLTGIARSLRNWRYTGANRLSVRPGTRVVCTLKDDAGGTVTDVCAIAPFADGCVLVAHSSTQQKAYLYRLAADLSTWTDSGGTTHATTSPQPIGVLWTGIPDCPEVTIAEGLGVAYIAHTAALDATSLAFPLKSFDDATRAIATVQSDVDKDGTPEDVYALGCVSFQQHLWIWGFGAGTVASDAYRPEMARFSQPIFDTSGDGLFLKKDSITLGNRVRSKREAIAGAFVAGEALYLGAPYQVTRVTGYGASSWFKEPLDSSYGFVGQKCGVAAGDTLYYWSPRGPMRVAPRGTPEPLFDAIQNLVEQVVNPQQVVAGFDSATDTVIFTFDVGNGTRTWAGFDVRREVWVGPDQDFGVPLRAMGAVAPIYAPTAAASLGPKGAPTTPVTTAVGATTATANWAAGDATSPSQVEYRQQGGGSWTVAASNVSAGVLNYTFTGLSSGIAYEWRVKHVKDGLSSSYLGPSAGTQFTTGASGGTLLAPSSPSVYAVDDDGNGLESFPGHANCRVAWVNSGESGVDTIVEMSSDGGATYFQQVDQPPGATSAVVVVYASGTYLFRMKHTRTAFTDSAYTTPVSVTVSIV